MADKQTIMIVDDDRNIAQLIRLLLEREGYAITTCERGDEALKAFTAASPDLLLLDIMLPGMDGWQVCRAVRQHSAVPIIMLSAKDETFDKVLGLELGADDYITKPFEPLEVAAKVKAQLRRLNVTSPQAQRESLITVGDMCLDLDECTFTTNGEVTELTKVEFNVLELLMSQPKRVFTKEQIYESAWYDDGAVDDNTIRVIISRLRNKVGAEHIKTIRGLGYRFEE